MAEDWDVQIIAIVIEFVVNNELTGIQGKRKDSRPPAIAKISRLAGIIGPALTGPKEFHGLGVPQQDSHGRFLIGALADRRD